MQKIHWIRIKMKVINCSSSRGLCWIDGQFTFLFVLFYWNTLLITIFVFRDRLWWKNLIKWVKIRCRRHANMRILAVWATCTYGFPRYTAEHSWVSCGCGGSYEIKPTWYILGCRALLVTHILRSSNLCHIHIKTTMTTLYVGLARTGKHWHDIATAALDSNRWFNDGGLGAVASSPNWFCPFVFACQPTPVSQVLAHCASDIINIREWSHVERVH